MKRELVLASLAATLAAAPLVPDVAMARHTTHRHVHHHVSHRCSGGSGVVGTIVGGAGGAVLAHAVIGGPVATVAGGVGGALLGRHIDKKNVRRRHGCR